MKEYTDGVRRILHTDTLAIIGLGLAGFGLGGLTPVPLWLSWVAIVLGLILMASAYNLLGK